MPLTQTAGFTDGVEGLFVFYGGGNADTRDDRARHPISRPIETIIQAAN